MCVWLSQLCVRRWVRFVCAGESDLCAPLSQICVRGWVRSVCVAEFWLCAPLSQICVRRWVPYLPSHGWFVIDLPTWVIFRSYISWLKGINHYQSLLKGQWQIHELRAYRVTWHEISVGLLPGQTLQAKGRSKWLPSWGKIDGNRSFYHILPLYLANFLEDDAKYADSWSRPNGRPSLINDVVKLGASIGEGLKFRC